ncbi:MAG: CCA tRNA nucleotidyltransferase [Patescibacteria group bacterium]
MTEEKLLQSIAKIAAKEKIAVYAVGGFVRDRIIGRPCKDVDFVVDGSGVAFAKKAREALKAEHEVFFEDFDTARMQVGEYTVEFAGARKETYDAKSRKPKVERVQNIAEDLARRDFTINTIAMHIDKEHFGAYVDPFDGQGDIERKIIRTPLSPAETFSDDPLRMLRAIRFAAQLGFGIDGVTLRGIKEEVKRITIISWERIRDELLKMLAAPKPSDALNLLFTTGLMVPVLPEVAVLHGVEFVGGQHHKDQLAHSIKVTDQMAAMTEQVQLRLAALLHDVGKAPAKRFKEGRGWTFDGHEVVGARMITEIGRRLRLDTDTTKYMRKLVRWHLRPQVITSEGVTDSAVRRIIVNMGDWLDDLILLYRADITTQNPKKLAQREKDYATLMQRIEEVRERDRLRAFQSPVRGEEIMELCNLTPGPEVGTIKQAIEEAILEGLIPNEYEAAKRYLLEHKDAWL